MGRPRKSRYQYYREYDRVVMAISKGKSLRKVSKEFGVSLSTCMRLKKLFFWEKYRHSRVF